MAAPTDGGAWNPWAALPLLVIWVLDSVFAALRADRWRTTLYLRNGLLADGQPLPPDQAQDQWTGPVFPNPWVLPGLVAAAAALLTAAVVGWPSFGSPGDGIWMFWLLVAVMVVLVLATVDHLARWHVDPERASPRAVDGAPRSAWSFGAAVFAVICIAVAVGSAVSVTFVAGILGMASLGRWVLVACASIVAVRVLRSERQQGRRLGLWDLIPSTGPVLVRGAMTLPPPPDLPPPPARS